MSNQWYTTPGKAATLARKAFRREVAAGRADWTTAGYEHDDRGRLAVHPGIAATSGAPVAPRRVAFSNSRTHARKRFGEGILRSLPTYRAPASFEDEAWWMEESRREEDRMFDRLAAEAEALDRMERGLDA